MLNRVFYTTDPGFAVPTLGSIHSLRRWSDVDVSIIVVGFSTAQLEAYAKLAEPLHVTIHAMDREAIEAFNRPEFNVTHVPPSAVARFFIPRFIAERDQATTDVLYLDGDTWFCADPRQLVEAPAPSRGLLAAEDQSFFFRHDVLGSAGKLTRAYFHGLGIDGNAGYFNSGVLKFRAETWRSIAADCLDYLEHNLARCRFHDESALNVVAADSRVRLSPAWNFQTVYWSWRGEQLVEPKLLHFAGGVKPWMGKLDAWRDIHDAYQAALALYDHPLFPLRRWNAAEQAAATALQEKIKRRNRTVLALRVLRRRRQLEALQRSSVQLPPTAPARPGTHPAGPVHAPAARLHADAAS